MAEPGGIDIADIVANPTSAPAASSTARAAVPGTVNVPVLDPNAQLTSINAAADRFARTNDALTQAASRLGGGGGEGIAAAMDKANADAELAKLKGASEDLALQHKTDAARELHTIPGAPDNLLVQMGVKQNAMEQDAMAVQQRIIDGRSKSFWDNPLDWVTTQIALPYDVDEYNSRVQAINQMSDYSGQISKRMDDINRQADALDSDAGAVKTALMARSAYAAGAVLASQLSMQAAQVGLHQLGVLSQLAEGDMRGAFASNDEQNKVVTDAQLHNANTIRQKIDDISLSNATLNEADKKVVYDTVDAINTYVYRNGSTKMSVEEYLRLPQNEKTALHSAVAQGVAGTGMLGNNVASSVRNAELTGASFSAQGTETLDYLKQTLASVELGVIQSNQATYKSWDQSTKDEKFSEGVKKLTDQSFLQSKGIYQPIKVDTAVKNIPTVASLEIMQPLIQIARSNPNQRIDPSQLASSMMDLVDKGMPAEQAAAQYQHVIAANQVFLNQTMDYRRFGLREYNTTSTTNNNTPYPVTIPNASSAMGGKPYTVVNGASQASLVQWIARQQMGKRNADKFMVPTGNPMGDNQ